MEKDSLKGIAYQLMAISFYLSHLYPVNHRKILLIMTHDESDDGNVGSASKYFNRMNPDLFFKKVTRSDYTFQVNKYLVRNLFYMFLVVPYHMATSRTIFMDNVFLPFSAIKPRTETDLVQLWHGTGSVKKFGLEWEEGRIKKLAQSTCSHTTHFIVGSRWMKNIYGTAFEAPDEKIFNIGCPRTDIFFREDLTSHRREEFFQEYPELEGKKIVLYAPTFRDQEKDTGINLDVEKLLSGIDESYVLGFRFHPKIASQINLHQICAEGPYHHRIFDFSNYNRLNTLLICSDILITDYSSIIYEYALLKRPIIFYSYDLDEFKNKGRGFYGEYEKMVPGPIALRTEDIIDLINNPISFDFDEFLAIYLENCDGEASKRLYALLME